ncbi:MAG: alkaline phosphatase family protein [Bryobacteraceae bacterium]
MSSLSGRVQAFAARPKLFVFVIAEQFRPVYLDRVNAQLGDGGFQRLRKSGAYYPNCRLTASSFTASGIASLVTGTYPELHGVVADRWFDRKTNALVKGRAEFLEATTLADEAVRANTKSRVFSLGMDEQPATLLAGRSSGAQVIFMDDKGLFAVRGSAPDWLPDLNRLAPPETLKDARWLAVGASATTSPLRTLTYDDNHKTEFINLYKGSPFAQEAQFRLLGAVITNEKLGQGDSTDFVFLSLGSMSLLGYETGSDSLLMEQMVLKMDHDLQGLLELLDKTPGAGKYNLIFTAAHGAPPAPKVHDQQTVDGEQLAQTVNKALAGWLDEGQPKGPYVEKYVYPFLYLKLDSLRKQNLPVRGARKLAGEVALRFPGVAGYYTADGECSHAGEWRRRFENSFHPLRSGDVMLSYEPEFVEATGKDRGISYGSLYNYDTRVPLILFGAQFRKQFNEQTIDVADLAPTVALAAGMPLPSSSTGQVLADAFAPEKIPE